MPSIVTSGKTYVHYKDGDRYRCILEAAVYQNPSKLCVVYAHEKSFLANDYLIDLAKRIAEKKILRNELILYGIQERDGKAVKIIFTAGKGFVIHPMEKGDELNELLVESTVWVRSKSDFFARVKSKNGGVVSRFHLPCVTNAIV